MAQFKQLLTVSAKIFLLSSFITLVGSQKKAAFWFNRYPFIRNPNGGYFARLARLSDTLTCDLPSRYGPEETRNLASANLHYHGHDSATARFHKNNANLFVNHLRGNPVNFHMIEPVDGNLTTIKLGSRRGGVFLFIPGGTWFSVNLTSRSVGSFALVGSTAVPAPIRIDSMAASRDFLLDRFPQHTDLILGFTPPN